MSGYITKDPDAKLWYGWDWADGGANDGSVSDPGWLQGDTIVTSTWSITGDGALAVDDDDLAGTVATVKLSGGTSGAQYTVTNHVVTAAGNEDDRSLIVRVQER